MAAGEDFAYGTRRDEPYYMPLAQSPETEEDTIEAEPADSTGDPRDWIVGHQGNTSLPTELEASTPRYFDYNSTTTSGTASVLEILHTPQVERGTTSSNCSYSGSANESRVYTFRSLPSQPRLVDQRRDRQ